MYRFKWETIFLMAREASIDWYCVSCYVDDLLTSNILSRLELYCYMSSFKTK